MDTAGSMVQMILSLGAVVAMILTLAWATRRMGRLRAPQSRDLSLKASLAVGMKERVLIVEAAGQQFLIGVAPGHVSILKALGPVQSAAVTTAASPAVPGAEGWESDFDKNQGKAPPSFVDALKQQIRVTLQR